MHEVRTKCIVNTDMVYRKLANKHARTHIHDQLATRLEDQSFMAWLASSKPPSHRPTALLQHQATDMQHLALPPGPNLQLSAPSRHPYPMESCAVDAFRLANARRGGPPPPRLVIKEVSCTFSQTHTPHIGKHSAHLKHSIITVHLAQSTLETQHTVQA